MLQARSVLKEEVSSWEGVSVHPHQFAAQEYRYGRAEVGHVHFWGDVDIPFPRSIRDFLLEKKLAEPHRWIPDSGWTTFRIRGDEDVAHAIWLMRLSYLRYALKSAIEAAPLLEFEDQRYSFGPGLVFMLSLFVPLGASRYDRCGRAYG